RRERHADVLHQRRPAQRRLRPADPGRSVARGSLIARTKGRIAPEQFEPLALREELQLSSATTDTSRTSTTVRRSRAACDGGSRTACSTRASVSTACSRNGSTTKSFAARGESI